MTGARNDIILFALGERVAQGHILMKTVLLLVFRDLETQYYRTNIFS